MSLEKGKRYKVKGKDIEFSLEEIDKLATY